MNEITGLLGWRTAADGWHIQWDFRGPAKLILCWSAKGVLQSQTGGEIEMSSLKREIRRFLREHAGQQLMMAMEVER